MQANKKERLDKLLVDREITQSRERAKALIMGGKVIVNDIKVDKSGIKVLSDASIRIKGNDIPYVSRGGIKLAFALDKFEVYVKDKVILDVGASTGGFTDCLLQRQAKKVYAVDVGYGQLAWKLRQDSRVVNLERRNIRYLDSKEIVDEIDLAVVDTSFISLTKVLPKVIELIRREASIIALIKPQFELGKGEVGRGGIVKDPEKHSIAVEKIKEIAFFHTLEILGLTESPISGTDGNKEFLIYLAKHF